MQWSIITPVHKRNAAVFQQTVASVRRQTCQDFEWVVVLNNEALGWDLSGMDLPPQTRVVDYLTATNKIGQIKQYAFSQGQGEWLVELDWDDLLTDDALEVLQTQADGADFLYSNVAYFQGEFNQDAVRFSAAHGWVSRPFLYRGYELVETVAHPVQPVSLVMLGAAPDHVRCWRRTFYHKSGRHHAHLGVGDDGDLIARTWLLGGVMRHVDRCLYLYRAEDNTCNSSRQAEIQAQSHANYLRYLEPVLTTWAERTGGLALDLCKAREAKAGFTAVDLWAEDPRVDLSGPWPWPDSSVFVCRAYDVFEHLVDKQHVMRELYRVLAPGGWVLSRTPSALGQGGWGDPTHVSGWVKNSFLYYTDMDYACYIRNTAVRFMSMRLEEGYPNPYCKEMGLLYVTFDGIALKGDVRPPGLVRM